ncbi:MAG TPA: iron-containing alcohol dehydrogenase [Steroidobacteraceae bacterium]|nr:iron-containing alcohol dehydrogenase [Steroidobacteraceae bacterium]
MGPTQPPLLTINNVGVLSFGSGAALRCAADLRDRGAQSVFLVTTAPTLQLCQPLIAALKSNGCAVTVWHEMAGEPTIPEFENALQAARRAQIDAVVGLGGGSAMDVAKLVAALIDGTQAIEEVLGVDRLRGRALWVACIPTTAGTGSEVTPIAILADETQDLKKGVVSRFLVPDAAYLDPQLTVSMPPAVTAATGLDALTHCVEAYANRFAHPLADIYARTGIELIAAYLERAVKDGRDLEARAALLRASLYGGMCLGPVNTAAVHALAYPLGGEFHIAHGLANALLLPHVLRFNLQAAPERYAEIAQALGARRSGDDLTDARDGVRRIELLIASCGVQVGMRHFGIGQEDIPRMASAAITVHRLLERNLRVITEQDARDIYQAAW